MNLGSMGLIQTMYKNPIGDPGGFWEAKVFCWVLNATSLGGVF
jgi:hypothetical protein